MSNKTSIRQRLCSGKVLQVLMSELSPMLHNLSCQLLRAVLSSDAAHEATRGVARDAAHDVAHDAAHDVAHDAAHNAAHNAARDAANDGRSLLGVMPCNLSCPTFHVAFSCQPLVHICAQLGFARRLAVLVADSNTTFALTSCDFRAGDTEVNSHAAFLLYRRGFRARGRVLLRH